MTIKRLIHNLSDTTKILLNESQAIVLFEHDNNEYSCIYIDLDDENELSKLNSISNIKSVRFVGGEELLHSIKRFDFKWPAFSRELLVDGSLETIFYSDTGKVRVAKTNLLKDKNEPSLVVKKKVLIVDDSRVIQKLLTKIINESESLEVMAVADRPSVAKEIIEQNEPDLITLDIHMPEMTGVDFLKTYLNGKNIPTVMISSVSATEGPLVMEALSNGAASYIQKPSISEIVEIAPRIISKLHAISERSPISVVHSQKVLSVKFEHFDGLIAIGSSTGGTQALELIFTSLPEKIPPIVVVQHIPAVFSKALADRLNTLCEFSVVEAEDGELIKPNTIYIAPGGRQCKVIRSGKDKRILISDDPPVNKFKPSVDYLFESVSILKEQNVFGVILTGMGKDGAKGLKKMKENGAFTIAQDEKSSVVFGMPKEAIRIDAAAKISSLFDIANDLVIQFNCGK